MLLTRMLFLLLITTCFCGFASLLALLPSKNVQQKILNLAGKIDDFVVSADKQTIYVASTNRLTAISSSNFSVFKEISIGPVKDSPWCSADGKSCLKDDRPVLTDVHTKILHVLPSNQLLQCGSVRLGSCSTFNSELTLLTKSDVPVAANSPDASTVSQIINDRIMVAASATMESPYRDPFPAVSIRKLKGLNVENAGNLEGEAAIFLRAAYRGSFNFVTTFSHEHFIFVVATITPKELRSPVTTRLIRFCKNDTKFVSYSEIELQCRGEDNTNYPFLNAIVQSDDKIISSFSMASDSKKSSICVFSMQKVKLTFWYNLDRCRSGSDSLKLPHIGRDTKCVNKAHIPLDADSCELGVGGSIELVEMSIKDIFSKITSLITIDHKVVLAGTSSSQIVMLKWENDSNSKMLHEYGRKEVGEKNSGNEIKKIVKYGDFVLIHLPHSLLMEEISTCSQHESCTECLLSVDPLCQWCHQLQSCTTFSKCAGRQVHQCPSAHGNPIPSMISVNSTSDIFLNIHYLPAPIGFTYKCQLGSKFVDATFTSSGVTCPSGILTSPGVYEIFLMTSNSTNPISRHNFSVFDCSQYETCSTCTSSNFDCQWCLKSHTCTNSCQTGATKVCVKILPMKAPIAVGYDQELVMEAKNLDTIDKNTNHFCKVNNTIVPARLGINSIRCGKIKLVENDETPENPQVPLSFMAKDHVLDITNVTLYSCSKLAADCSSCLALLPSLSCNWCNQKCLHNCPAARETTVCDPPRIIKFEPSSGPVEGGTIIKIYGKDLGMSLEDVRGKIYVAGSRCNIVEYLVSNMIACQVDEGVSSGTIRISVGRVTMAVAESHELFSFVRISIFSAYPLYGPISGGTKIKLYGQNLASGSQLSVSIGGKPCPIHQNNSSSVLTCLTPQGVSVGKSSKVVVHVDNARIPLDQPFEYRPDPSISSIFPKSAFRAGGRIISVQGSSLNTVQAAQMFLALPTYPFDFLSHLAPCHIINSTFMTCISPKIFESNIKTIEYTKLSVGFLMDNVTAVANLGRRIQMAVYPNPSLTPFKGTRYHQGDQPLILEGHNLNLAAEPNDFKIFIGKERCYVTIVDIRQLVCSGPILQPKATDESGLPINGGNPLVTVITGSIRMELGLIEYSDHGLPSRLSVLILGLCLFIFIALASMCLVLKKRRQEREKEYRKIQLQMENLENNVRKECKQAFTELQTNLVLSPKCTATRIQTELVNFPQFVENLLWADNVLTSTPSLARTLPATLAQFHALLSYKEFIIAVVESAESDISMSTTEKSILASLLISVLLRNFDYCTEIVVDLLRAHIAKSVKNKRAELLFRNSDSVVEKMFSKWMSICLYSQLTPQMNSFFNLYKALQYQTDKGPVDAVTGDARYTINEARLLRENVETKVLKLNVIPLTKRDEVIQLEVHECDAICQLKQKIVSAVYWEIPYSQRPRITQFELGFNCIRRGDVKLIEVSTSGKSSKKNLPVKLLTLADYGIQDGNTLEMTPAACATKNYRDSITDSGQSSWSSLDRCSSIYSASEYYHLTNPSSGTMAIKKKSGSEIPNSIPEVYLTRLLTSKGIVESYVADFLESVLYMHNSRYPAILKFLFDTLDCEGAANGVSENICQQWKANGFVLRVWANFVRNPQLVFDVPHSVSMDANLSTVAQTLMDCFSFSEPVLSAHSPSSRLLFAKDVARLRPLSVDLFRKVKNSSFSGQEELRMELVSITNDVTTCKGSSLALSELLSWVRGNGIRISQLLSSNSETSQQRLAQKLSQVLHVCLETDTHIYSTISDYEG